jgi:tRNA A-37 threonylcarbamoyl transferase component Bud32
VELYAALARMVRRMHDAGFVHNDLHGGNVLVSGAPSAPELRIIDLHSVTGPGRPSVKARWFDLAKLLHSLLTCSSEDERTAMLVAYDGAGEPSQLGIGAALRAGRLRPRLEARLAGMEEKRVRSRTERSLDRSSRFDVARHDGYRVHHLRTLPIGDVMQAVRDHVATANGIVSGDVLKDARRSALTRQALGSPHGGRTVIVKEYLPGSPFDRLKNLVRRPRAVSAWLGGNGLLVRHFDVAEPFALVLGPRLTGSSFLLMEDLGDRSRLDLVALERFAGRLDADERRAKRELVHVAAALLRRLHGSGAYHGDFKAVNLFLREGAGAPSIALADYDRVAFGRPVARRRCVKNLSQLSASVGICITLCDRLRFFREYAAGDAVALCAWKTWFREVVDACRRKIVVEWDPIE